MRYLSAAYAARRFLLLLLYLFLTTTTIVNAQIKGGELAYFDTIPMTQGVSHRQDVCPKYEEWRSGSIQLKDALAGMQLNVAVAAYPEAYFIYDSRRGIAKEYPGLAAVILDELGRRAKFSWRDSFGVTGDPADHNATWSELLSWSIDSYDLHVEWWAQNLERMNNGVAFMKEWYDASIILITKESPEEVSDEINFWNWLRPYEAKVWWMTVFTILISGLIYQVLEWYADDRRDRPWWQWWQENAYLSAINFTQAYEYQPKTFASRLFGVSMAIWALVMTATYTANLASLLVDRKPPKIVAQSMDEIVVFGNRVCTWAGTWSDDFIKTNHPNAIRVEKQTVKEMYTGLLNGDCEFAADAVASWNKLKTLKEYNPYCNLYWLGGDRKVSEVYASFVGKVDAGEKCTSFILDVLNLHMLDMIQDGFLADAWDREYKRTATVDCDTYRPEIATVVEQQLNSANSTGDGRRRELRAQGRSAVIQRQLKGAGAKAAAGGAVAASAASESSDAEKLTLEQMIGTFAFHWCIMGISLIIANVNALYNRYQRTNQKGDNSNSTTKRTADLSEYFYNESDESGENGEKGIIVNPSMPITASTEQDLQAQLAYMRQTQNQMRQSQAQMEQYQRQMQQSQLAILQEQRQLQLQLQRLLGGQGSALPPMRTDMDAAMNSSFTDFSALQPMNRNMDPDSSLRSSRSEWDA